MKGIVLMDYGAAAAKYVDAFMQNVNWEGDGAEFYRHTIRGRRVKSWARSECSRVTAFWKLRESVQSE